MIQEQSEAGGQQGVGAGLGRARRIFTATAILGLSIAIEATPAHAGCGCEKPPPPPAQVRPEATYPGTPVTLFPAGLVAGQAYDVVFHSSASGERATVTAQAEVRRDIADGQKKVQLEVSLPALPPGPAGIEVWARGAERPLSSATDASFTVVSPPIAVPSSYGNYRWPGYRAAVGRDGVAYIAIDVSNMTKPMVFEATAAGLPLRFGNDDVVFHNIQGFVMQRLVVDPTKKEPEGIPGMFAVPAAAGSADSDAVHYSRHEFATYFLQHFERQPHALDASDPNWHLDGTRHVDHDHLILAIAARYDDGSSPAPGATPAFDLVVDINSLFNRGVVGSESVSIEDDARVDSYDFATGTVGTDGDVFSNGKLKMKDRARVDGNVTAGEIDMTDTARIAGRRRQSTGSETFMEVKIPSAIQSLDDIKLVAGSSMTITGPGSFLVKDLIVGQNASLFIDNSAGPVTLYVTGKVQLRGAGAVSLADPTPESFAVYVAGNGSVDIKGDKTGQPAFTGVLYSPRGKVSLSGQGKFFGAFVGKQFELKGSSEVHYDASLRRAVQP